MKISYDSAKRLRTLAERGLDFNDAPLLFGGRVRTLVDDRADYGEVRSITHGYLNGRAVVLVWTQRNEGIRIISMRHAHAQEMARVGLD
ncbi:BrnT family toxin [Sandaracinobacteroides saxicola]|uniref:BrnT family toxin n=1 Tax=Sandaracinobacteroides saxicola TaxID=2759707 RepID=A0A7G5IHQ3_9SPHN|nr:BrnT family toxin [Sandaracinobacteroides saxicola]QMW22895.1 BrnT family toxin [Sandaracinobacteroides saxicola]